MVNGEKNLKIMQTKNFNLDKDRNLIRSWRREINQIDLCLVKMAEKMH